MSTIRNFAILAHVDAGKTTLSERILFNSHEIEYCGEVEEGLATMDYLAEEKEKGITIEAGLASYNWKSSKVNFLDTPGHIDFSAEVDLSLESVDGAVIILSAVRGIETQSRMAWTKITERSLPAMAFINKLDQGRGKFDEILIEIEEEFEKKPILLNFPIYEKEKIVGVVDVLNGVLLTKDPEGRETGTQALSSQYQKERDALWYEALEAASDCSESILEKVLENTEVKLSELIPALKKLFASGKAIPVYSGSGLGNFGVRQLMTGIHLFFEPGSSVQKNVLGSVIKIRNYKNQEMYLIKVARNFTQETMPEGMRFYSIKANEMVEIQSLELGDIVGMICEKKERQIGQFHLGDLISKNGCDILQSRNFHYQPLLQTRVECTVPEDQEQLDRSLKILDHSDPSLFVENSGGDGAWVLHTVGEVHLEVLLSRLKREFSCKFYAGSPIVEYHERLINEIESFEHEIRIGPHHAKGFFALSGNSEVNREELFKFQVINKTFAPEFFELKKAAFEAYEELLHNGVLGKGSLESFGYKIEINEITEDFPPGLLKKMIQDAFRLKTKTTDFEVLEPIMQLDIEVPDQWCGNIIADLESKKAVIEKLDGNGKKTKIIASLPLKTLFGYSIIVRSISKGTASYALRYQRHRRVSD